MQCSVHNGRIKGKVHRWNHRPMCGKCYRYFTRRVHLVQARHKPTPARRQDRSLLDRLRAWFR